MGSIAPRDYGIASSIISTMRSAGMLTSMTIITVLLSYYLGNQKITPATSILFLSTMRTAMIMFSLMGLIAMLLSIVRTKN
ncbi:MAG: hypothetical protein HQK69_10415 [Desulfamplus sp.]|nr:hypothetical protein [Desulfamplus sp.]